MESLVIPVCESLSCARNGDPVYVHRVTTRNIRNNNRFRNTEQTIMLNIRTSVKIKQDAIFYFN